MGYVFWRQTYKFLNISACTWHEIIKNFISLIFVFCNLKRSIFVWHSIKYRLAGISHYWKQKTKYKFERSVAIKPELNVSMSFHLFQFIVLNHRKRSFFWLTSSHVDILISSDINLTLELTGVKNILNVPPFYIKCDFWFLHW